MFADFLTGYTSPPNYASLLSVVQYIVYEDIVQFILNMCLCDVCSLILIEPHTYQI